MGLYGSPYDYVIHVGLIATSRVPPLIYHDVLYAVFMCISIISISKDNKAFV